MAFLFLVRHGKSTWNDLGQWTGHTDVDLSETGIAEARAAGEALKNETIHIAYVSALRRTHQTLAEILKELGIEELETRRHHAINERHYGIHTGKNKWQVKEEIGDEAFQALRRGWDVPIPEGESLKDVHARVVPYYEEQIKNDLLQAKNVLIVAHGNSLRALVKHLEQITDDTIGDLEIGTGEVYCYQFDDACKILSKEIRSSNSDKRSV